MDDKNTKKNNNNAKQVAKIIQEQIMAAESLVDPEEMWKNLYGIFRTLRITEKSFISDSLSTLVMEYSEKVCSKLATFPNMAKACGDIYRYQCLLFSGSMDRYYKALGFYHQQISNLHCDLEEKEQIYRNLTKFAIKMDAWLDALWFSKSSTSKDPLLAVDIPDMASFEQSLAFALIRNDFVEISPASLAKSFRSHHFDNELCIAAKVFLLSQTNLYISGHFANLLLNFVESAAFKNRKSKILFILSAIIILKRKKSLESSDSLLLPNIQHLSFLCEYLNGPDRGADVLIDEKFFWQSPGKTDFNILEAVRGVVLENIHLLGLTFDSKSGLFGLGPTILYGTDFHKNTEEETKGHIHASNRELVDKNVESEELIVSLIKQRQSLEEKEKTRKLARENQSLFFLFDTNIWMKPRALEPWLLSKDFSVKIVASCLVLDELWWIANAAEMVSVERKSLAQEGLQLAREHADFILLASGKLKAISETFKHNRVSGSAMLEWWPRKRPSHELQSMDDQILQSIKDCQFHKIELISSDLNMRLKAKVLNIPTRSFNDLLKSDINDSK